MKLVSLVITLFFLCLISGCITTHIKGYSDPDYFGYKMRNVAVLIDSDNAEVIDSALSAIKDNLRYDDVIVQDYWEVVPLSKARQVAEVKQRLIESYIGTILYIKFGSGNKETNIVGSYTNMTANVYGNSVYGSGFTIPITAVNRDSFGEVKVLNVNDDGVVWAARFNSESEGALYSDLSIHVENSIKSIMDELKELNLIQKFK